MMYDDEAVGDGRLGRFIDRWALNFEASRAVKNRRGMLNRAIRDIVQRSGAHPAYVTSLASGPARELFDLFTGTTPPDIKATCIDIDNQALAYAAELAKKHGVSDRFSFAQDNIVRLAHGRGKTVLKPQHMIYSIGLIDYLRDEFVIKLFDWIHERLLPGGTAVVGNFATTNPGKAFMDHILEWELIYRTPEDLQDLFARSRFGDTPVRVEIEEAGVNLFAFCVKAG